MDKRHPSVAETLLDHKHLLYPFHNTPFRQTHKSGYPNERDGIYPTSLYHMNKNPPKSVVAVVVPNIVVRIAV